MKHSINFADEQSIRTNIGPIAFNILIDSAFFNCITLLSSERHKHATYEFHFITRGAGTIITDGMQYEVASGSYYIVNAGVYHMQKGSASDPMHRFSFKFEFDISSAADTDYSEEEIKNFVYSLSNVQFFYSPNLNKIRHIISEIQSELINKAPGYYSKVQHLFSLLFIAVVREISSEYKHELKNTSIKTRKDRISIIDNYFDLNFDRKVTIKDLCNLVHLSKSQLNRILREKYGMTFKQKHIETQIEHIKDMLVNTGLPIKTIAERTGYTSESNFTAFFKHACGLSPTAFRKQNSV